MIAGRWLRVENRRPTLERDRVLSCSHCSLLAYGAMVSDKVLLA